MTKVLNRILVVSAALAIASPAWSMPSCESQFNNGAGLLGQLGSSTLKDPLIKKAIESLKESQMNGPKRYKKPVRPENPVGKTNRFQAQKNMILGGPELIPM